MQNLWVLVLCFTVGYLLRITKRIPDNAHRTINTFILYVSLPAQILLFVPKIAFSAELLLPAGMAWIVFFFTYGILLLIKKRFSIDTKAMGCLVLTAGLGNTSFLGIPMIEVFFGKEFNSIGILCDQPGTFLILSIVGIPIALHHSSLSIPITKNKFRYKIEYYAFGNWEYPLLWKIAELIYEKWYIKSLELVKRIITFPPFISFLLAIALSQFDFSSEATSVLSRLGDTLAPLALFSVGFQFKLTGISKIKKNLFLGLILKMIFAPLFIFFLYEILLKNTSMISKISIFEAAMPPMITGGIIAIENDLAPDLASMMIAVGVLFSTLTLPFWKFIL